MSRLRGKRPGAFMAGPTMLVAAALLWAPTPLAAQAEGAQDGSAQAEATNSDAPTADRPERSGRPLPRFVSLRAAEVNLRAGPGTRYPIEWVYKRPNLPVEVIDEFDTWRQIRDRTGTVGWVHQSMLQGRRHVQVADQEQLLRREPKREARIVARLEAGVIARLLTCDNGWCAVEAAGHRGWLERDQVFGIYPKEEVR